MCWTWFKRLHTPPWHSLCIYIHICMRARVYIDMNACIYILWEPACMWEYVYIKYEYIPCVHIGLVKCY